MKKVFASIMIAGILSSSLWAISLPQTTAAKSGASTPAANAMTATTATKKPAKKRHHRRPAKK